MAGYPYIDSPLPDRTRPRRVTTPPPPPPGINTYDLETAGQAPPRTAVGPVAGDAPAPPSQLPPPPAEPHADLANGLPMTTDIQPQIGDARNVPFYRQSMERSTNTEGLNSVGQRLKQIEELRRAGPDQKVFVGSDGNIETEYPHKLSRGKEALMGLLQGALAGGAAGGWKGAVGGAATGAIAGGVNPKLMASLERHQEIERLQRGVNEDIGNQAKQQQIALQGSQITENLAQAERARTGTPHYERDNQGNLKAVYDTNAYQVTDPTTGVPVVGKDPDAETEGQRLNREETKRYHDAQIKQRQDDAKKREQRQREQANRLQLHIDPTSGDHVVFNPATGKEFTAKRGSKQAVKLAQANALWQAAGKQYDTDAKPKFDQADVLREEADKLGQNEAGEDDPGQAMLNKAKIAAKRKQADQLEREAEGIAAKVRMSQSKGDELAAEAQAAGATGKAKPSGKRGGSAQPAAKGQVSRAKFRAKYPDYKDRSDAEVDRAITSSGYSPIP